MGTSYMSRPSVDFTTENEIQLTKDLENAAKGGGLTVTSVRSPVTRTDSDGSGLKEMKLDGIRVKRTVDVESTNDEDEERENGVTWSSYEWSSREKRDGDMV
jgi:hypothetical protein